MKDQTNRSGFHEPVRRSLNAPDLYFHQLVDAVHDYAVFLLDSHGTVISWNQGAERIKGYEAEEIIGRHFSIFYPPEAEKGLASIRIGNRKGRWPI